MDPREGAAAAAGVGAKHDGAGPPPASAEANGGGGAETASDGAETANDGAETANDGAETAEPATTWCPRAARGAAPRPATQLKRTCEPCTTSKVKCSGEHPCARCQQHRYECVYRVKMRRGPPPRPRPPPEESALAKVRSALRSKRVRESAGSGRRTSPPPPSSSSVTAPPPKRLVPDRFEEGSPAFLRETERVVWKLFFAAYRAARKQSLNLCWYHLILERLQSNLEETRPELGRVLDAWMDESGVNECLETTEIGCSFAPEVCSWCSSVALGAAAASAPPPPYAATAAFELDHTKPMMEFNMNAHKGEFAGLVYGVNDEFADMVGLDTDDLNAFVEWTGGAGMLPWGCDAFAAFFAKEQDLLHMLLTLSRRFHSLGHPAHGASVRRDIPFSTVADVRLKDGRVASCLVRVNYAEIIDPHCIRLLATAGFELVGPAPHGGVRAAASDVSLGLEGWELELEPAPLQTQPAAPASARAASAGFAVEAEPMPLSGADPRVRVAYGSASAAEDELAEDTEYLRALLEWTDAGEGL